MPGVYCWWLPDAPDAREAFGFTDEGARFPLYVGKAQQALSRRVPEHLKDQDRGRTEFRFHLSEWLWALEYVIWSDRTVLSRPPERALLLQPFERELRAVMNDLDLTFVPCRDATEAGALEREVLRELDPFFNRAGVGPKHLREDRWWRGRVTKNALASYIDWEIGLDWAGWTTSRAAQIASLPPNLALEVQADAAGFPRASRVVRLDAPTPSLAVRLHSELAVLDDEIISAELIEPFWGRDGRSPITNEPYPPREAVLASLTPAERVILGVLIAMWEMLGAADGPDG